MSVWNRATDVQFLRKGVRFGLVGAVAVLLAAQLLSVQKAAAVSLVTCPQLCTVSLKACSNLCAAGYGADAAQCQLTGALCVLQCVLNGYSYGPALTACQTVCSQGTQACLQTAVKDSVNCYKVCSTQYAICNLICTLIAGLQ